MKRYWHSIYLLLAAVLSLLIGETKAQSVLFDFDNAPLHSPLPIDLTVGGVTAHFSGNPSYYNFSIQTANALGFTPVGFVGYCIYPNTIYACDLLISFNRQLTAASILYAPEEYATDSSCTMRMTAYLGTTFVGTNTYSILEPGTWPSGTLSFSSTQPFDNVVIHYDRAPVTGGDYGPIFMADNLVVTPAVGLTTLSAVSRKTHGGAGDFDVDLPLSGAAGIECRSGGATGDHTLVITFNNPVVSGSAAVTTGTGSVAGVPAFSANTMTINLTGIANLQTVALTLSGVTSSSAQTLPDTVISAGFLLGDTNGDGVVNSGDTVQTRNRSGQTTDATNFRSDVNLDGTINSGDQIAVRARSGTSLP